MGGDGQPQPLKALDHVGHGLVDRCTTQGVARRDRVRLAVDRGRLLTAQLVGVEHQSREVDLVDDLLNDRQWGDRVGQSGEWPG